MARTGSDLATQLADILRSARGSRPLTSLAEEAGYSRNSLLELETGTRGDREPTNPTLARAERIATAYGLRLKLTAEPIRPARKRSA